MNKSLALFLIGFIVAFTSFKLLGAKKEGLQPQIGFNIILWRGHNHCDHIHHWITLSILVLFAALIVHTSNGKFSIPSVAFIFGALFGGIFEDFTYADWYVIEEPCPKK